MTDGILLIDKPEDMTSFDVVARVRKLYGTRQVGHTGTLDPLATGLLAVLVGRAVKASEFLTEKDKEYCAGLHLGMTTDTEDVTGTVLTRCGDIPPKETVLSAAKSFIGEIRQTPPMYSALKVNGEKLVDLARRGITVEREARPVSIRSLEIDGDGTDYTMRVVCSRGTYIRTLCADIGKALGCGGVMSSLRRLKTGDFSLAGAHTLEKIESMNAQERASLLLPTETLFLSFPKIVLPEFYEKLAKNGCEIYQKKLGTSFDTGTRLRVCGKDGFFAVGEVREYPEGIAIKLLKRFDKSEST